MVAVACGTLDKIIEGFETGDGIAYRRQIDGFAPEKLVDAVGGVAREGIIVLPVLRYMGEEFRGAIAAASRAGDGQ